MHHTFLHTGWQFAEKSWQAPGALYGYSFLEWLPANVPGHVHLDLAEHGIIPDPFDRMNELGVQWVDDRDWAYRTTFEWTPKEGLPRRVLRFEGLDTACDVILNGEVLACHDSMFLPLEVDVTEKLKEGENELRIDFVSARRVADIRRKNYFEREGIREDVAWFHERSFIRKVQCMFGWDWGPRLISCGIWKEVTLLEFESRIREVTIRQHLNLEEDIVTLKIEVEGEGPGVAETDIFDPSGECIGTVVGNGEFVIESPELWWPNGEGEPNLYSLVTSLGDDERTTAIGIRSIKLVRKPDAMGESFEFEVNGRALWIRGANWIPDHSFPAKITATQYRKQVERAADMNMNMLRIWGGGLYEQEAFYDACDSLGILVWQDFMFACSHAPDTDEYYAAIEQEASFHIRRLRNRASHAIWCGNNENCQVWFDKWGGAENAPPRFFGEHLYFELFPRLVAELDPGKDYWPGSAWGGDSPNQGGIGDQHNWDVWHGRGDWRHYTDSTARFCSEFGFAASPALSTWANCLDEADWDPRSPGLRWHDKTKKGTETFIGYVKLHYPDPVTVEDWVYYSQLNQRDALRYGIEHYRRSEFCRGTLIWQLNDCWPTQSWAVVDSEANYKAAAYELRRIYADVLLSIERDKDQIRVYAVNDTDLEFAAPIWAEAVHLTTGEVEGSWDAEVELGPNDRKVGLTFSVAGLSVPDTLIRVGGIAGMTWQLLAEPKEVRLAPAAEILVSVAEDGILGWQTSSVVVDLMFTAEGSTIPFEDNFFTGVMAGIVPITEIPARIEARSLAGVHPVRIVRGKLSP